MKTFELVETTPETAKAILETGSRVIAIENGDKVQWINLNNETLRAGKGSNDRVRNLEDVKIFIRVPLNAKTVY